MKTTRAPLRAESPDAPPRLGEPGRDFAFTAADFERIRALIYRRAGISLSEHKRDMAYSRLARRLRACGLDTFRDYLDRLERDDDPAEWEAFTNALTTNLTAFFREAHHFPILADFAKRRELPLSIWCSAASTGEEPYSIAIALIEALGAQAARGATILATDLDTQVLAKAEAGIYTWDQVKHLSPERLKRFFLKGTGAQAGRVKVRPELRAMIRFEQLNLTDADYRIAQPFDAIFCRNVMIYFDKPTQAQVLARFEPLVKPGGLLFAGHSENFSYVTQAFRLRGQTVYERARDAAGAVARGQKEAVSGHALKEVASGCMSKDAASGHAPNDGSQGRASNEAVSGRAPLAHSRAADVPAREERR